MKNLKESWACLEEIKEGFALGPPLLASISEDGEDTQRACPATLPSVRRLLLVLHHLFIGGRGGVAVGRRGWVSHASVGRTGLDLESHCHGIANRIHPRSSRVGVIWWPQLLGSWSRV